MGLDGVACASTSGFDALTCGLRAGSCEVTKRVVVVLEIFMPVPDVVPLGPH
jgi:hypothetical protein